MKKLIIIASLSAFIFSCEKTSNFPTYENMDVTSEFVLNNAIIISEGDCAGDLQAQTYICFESIVGDSRCPEGVQCIWQGNAEAKFKFVKTDETPVFFSLNTYPAFTTDTIIGEYKFTLKAVTPYPNIKNIVLPRAYKAEIEIEKVTE